MDAAPFYHNDGARLRDVTASMSLPPLRGWWYSLATGDFNHDGRPDLVAGNLGLNYTYTTSEQGRFGSYAADFTGNGTSDVVLTQEIDGTEYPFFGSANGAGDLPAGGEIPSYRCSQKHRSRSSSVPPNCSVPSITRRIPSPASICKQWGWNVHGVPAAKPGADLTDRGIIAHDVDGDGNLDLIVAGNLYDAEPNTPRADAGNGLWLKGDGHWSLRRGAPSPKWLPRAVGRHRVGANQHARREGRAGGESRRIPCGRLQSRAGKRSATIQDFCFNAPWLNSICIWGIGYR